MHRVQHHHALFDLRLVVDELATAAIAAPDPKHRLSGHLFHLLDHRLQFARQGRDRPLLHHHTAIATTADDDVVLAPLGVLLGVIVTELSAPTLLAQDGGP